VTQIIERVKAHYEVQAVEMGTVYRWCPESAVLECNCKTEITLTATKPICPECASDHSDIVGEVLEAEPKDEIERPWRSPHPYYKPTRGT
jgi:Zn finger protein HypA/HybF involved in hydrogenase expression